MTLIASCIKEKSINYKLKAAKAAESRLIMLKEITNLAEKFENNAESIKVELKRVQSIKCRLKKQKCKDSYEKEMLEVVSYEQALKEARDYLEPKSLTVTTMTIEDIKLLNHEETIRAIKSIQSKKCNTQYLTNDIKTNVEYQKACEIEQLLLEHKKTVKPLEDTVVKKSEINNLIANLESLDKVKKDYILEQLRNML